MNTKMTQKTIHKQTSQKHEWIKTNWYHNFKWKYKQLLPSVSFFLHSCTDGIQGIYKKLWNIKQWWQAWLLYTEYHCLCIDIEKKSYSNPYGGYRDGHGHWTIHGQCHADTVNNMKKSHNLHVSMLCWCRTPTRPLSVRAS